MFRLRRKNKIPEVVDESRMRSIIQEELRIHDTDVKDIEDKQRRREELRNRIMNLPIGKRKQFMRYLEGREKNGKTKT